MKSKIWLFFLVSFLSSVSAQAETNLEVLRKVWDAGHERACSKDARAAFSETNFHRIHALLTSSTDRTVLASALNPFLASLGYSHTQFFTEKDESYYLFKGWRAEADPTAPAAPLLVNPGIQLGVDDRGYYAREVLHGFPARAAGVVKGDRILAVNGKAFYGSWGTVAKPDALVRISHQGVPRDMHLALPASNWSQAFQDATLSSIEILESDGFRVGYVRLWSGVHPESATALWMAVKKFRAEGVDGVILDLRGGYGGAFWSHLDPFFADRTGFFEMSATDGDDQTSLLQPKPQDNPEAYTGPLVVLINEGSRSGKEAMAYQFKKSGRAPLVGSATPGYFSGGQIFFGEENLDYLLYLCVMRDSKLDGTVIEGVGIRPDLSVEFSSTGAQQDSQLEAGLWELLLASRLIPQSTQKLFWRKMPSLNQLGELN